ncbi:glycosyltransferase family 2 protein [Algibacter sp. 2305UL17-15]|uniref:glycosyltransferase family 2 protein n=1 Tax=Algibacter sp. 2305UL17-15 TaxID=3231268 RepID=UPI00345A9463
MNPLISILIPTYNRAGLIGETLASVLGQEYKKWECIVVDDGSTDETDKILNAFCKIDSRFIYAHRPSNRQKGANACRNYGFEISKGDFIQLLDSDDILEPNCLSERVNLIVKSPDTDVLVRDTGVIVDANKEFTAINIDPDKKSREAYLRLFLSYHVPWHTSSALYKRNVFSTCKFDERLARFQDVSFNIKILSANKDLNILRNPKIDTFYRVEKEKKITKTFLCILMKSLSRFNTIHTNLSHNINYKSDLRLFNINFFNDYFLDRIKENKKDVFILIISYLKGNLFSLKQKFYFVLCFIFYATGIIHIKGIGMYRFNKAYTKVFKSE